ncbi:MAG: hypothetical protein ACOCZ5_00850 [bacterium]
MKNITLFLERLSMEKLLQSEKNLEKWADKFHKDTKNIKNKKPKGRFR